MSESISIAPAPARELAGVTLLQDTARATAILTETLGLAAPEGPRFTQNAEYRLFRIAPARFFATGPENAGLPARLTTALAGLGAVTDQTDAWAIFSLRGAALSTFLARLVPVDTRESAFAPGTLVLTRSGHMDVRLWRVAADHADIAVGRSFREDFLEFLTNK